ncbi:cupin domain-containing protein [Halorussus salinisoli]|uniref:cupin domain-containing protein n=1 Tax=Halorussus salinisoli TaxID=2558242 RepID=UPI0010C1F3B0|nr:cupin domain-containing protein [Halorussus salinisoli]
MEQEWGRISLDDTDSNREKPGTRWEVSPKLDIDAYNYNIAVLEPSERLSANAYHYHEEQAELFHVVEQRCRVETDGDSFDLTADELVYFQPGVPHLLHNPFEKSCKLIGVGSPPEGRYPVHQVESYEDLLAERYPNGETTEPSTEVD